MQENLIGEFLRARRELVRPEAVGISELSARRRVVGLRREEVAMLAGVCNDYYVRLEQGRDQNPSRQVLDALAQALQLDDDATDYLYRLANPPTRRRRDTAPVTEVPPGILDLLATSQTPAYVHGRHMDVLAANPLATALAPWLTTGTNLLRAVFLDGALHDTRPDWRSTAKCAVAAFRSMVGPEAGDRCVKELVCELSADSELFRLLWAEHDARHMTNGTSRFEHPLVGPVDLTYEKLQILGRDRQMIVFWHAVPGSASAEALTRLEATATEDR